jgi:hypothetical protein
MNDQPGIQPGSNPASNTTSNAEVLADEILLYVLGELGEDRRRIVESAMASDPNLAADAAQMARAADAVRTDPDPRETELLIQVLQKTLAESQPAIHFSGRSRWRTALTTFGALAALMLIAIAIIWAQQPKTAHAAIVWQDVVHAVGEVKALHAVEYWDDPDKNLDKRTTRLDSWFRAPNLWRGQGRGIVQFVNRNGAKFYDVEKRRFVERKEMLLTPLANNVQLFNASAPGESILSMLFDGQPPRGNPVPTSMPQMDEDLQAFDYVRGPDDVARIWVLKKSRLPVRVELLSKGTSISLHLSYPEPLPESFFDANALDQAVRQKNLTDPIAILKAPVDPGQD